MEVSSSRDTNSVFIIQYLIYVFYLLHDYTRCAVRLSVAEVVGAVLVDRMYHNSRYVLHCAGLHGMLGVTVGSQVLSGSLATTQSLASCMHCPLKFSAGPYRYYIRVTHVCNIYGWLLIARGGHSLAIT